MNIHEYQAKLLFKEEGIPVLNGILVNSVNEAEEVYNKLNTSTVVLKAQVHAGGRGKGGGIKLAKSAGEAKSLAEQMLHSKLVTHQTGVDGKIINSLYFEEGCEVEKELYFSIVIDRNTSSPVIICSREGGMDIEELAINAPEKLMTVRVHPTIGLKPFQAKEIAYFLDPKRLLIKEFMDFVDKALHLFCKYDMSLFEINPLAIVKGKGLIALDAKMNFDDRALFKHPSIAELRDEREEDRLELEADNNGLSYVSLDGNIGCMINGAGLAMSTMDIIMLHNGKPANFLDVGGGATADQVAKAFEILLKNKSVKVILINIFGGIMKCDIIASGIVQATKKIEINVPLVVRLEGTNVELGRKILEEADIDIITAVDMEDAAKKAVDASNY